MTAHPYNRLAALREHLAARGFEVRLSDTSLIVIAPVDETRPGPRLADTITCRVRADDEDRLWFWTSWDDPIALADNIVEAGVIVAGNLASRHLIP